MMFFELFIENKNLIKQGLYLLEICQNAAGSTDRRGHDGPSWTSSSHTCAISSAALFIPSMASMMDRHKHDGPSRVFVPKYFNSWNMGTGITSLNFMTNLHDGPSHTRRTVVVSVTLHLVWIRLPHLPSAAALRCHLRTVTSTTDHHKLRSWSLLHFFAQNLRIKRNLYKNYHKKGFWTH